MLKRVRRWLRRLLEKPPLTRADLKQGLRVRFREDVDLWPLCIVRKGQTGTIEYVNKAVTIGEDDILAAVVMHEYYPDLKEWDNVVHVHPDGSDGGPVMPSDLEAL